MTKHERASLWTKLRETVLDLQLHGVTVTTQVLTQTVRNRFPDLCEAEKDRLFHESLSSRFRHIMKSTASSMKSPQWSLPLALKELRVPAMVPLMQSPAFDTDTGEYVQPADVEWKPIEEVTFSQLRTHLHQLLDSIQKDRARYEALAEVEQFLRPHMDNEEHQHEAIGPVLAEIAAKETEEKK